MSSSKLCEICGCVVFDQTKDLCDACSKDVYNKLLDPPAKMRVYDVDNSASSSLESLNKILKIIAIIIVIVGVIVMLIGVPDFDWRPEVLVSGFVIILSAIPIFMVRPIIGGLKTITEASEYIKADIEKNKVA